MTTADIKNVLVASNGDVLLLVGKQLRRFGAAALSEHPKLWAELVQVPYRIPYSDNRSAVAGDRIVTLYGGRDDEQRFSLTAASATESQVTAVTLLLVPSQDVTNMQLVGFADDHTVILSYGDRHMLKREVYTVYIKPRLPSGSHTSEPQSLQPYLYAGVHLTMPNFFTREVYQCGCGSALLVCSSWDNDGVQVRHVLTDRLVASFAGMYIKSQCNIRCLAYAEPGVLIVVYGSPFPDVEKVNWEQMVQDQEQSFIGRILLKPITWQVALTH